MNLSIGWRYVFGYWEYFECININQFMLKIKMVCKSIFSYLPPFSRWYYYRPLTGGPPGPDVRKADFELKGAVLVLHLSQCGGCGGGEPAVPWVNLELVGCPPASYLPSPATRGGLLLLTDHEITLAKLNEYVQVETVLPLGLDFFLSSRSDWIFLISSSV